MQYQVSIWRKNDQVRLVKVSHWGTYQIRYLYTHVECGFDYLLRNGHYWMNCMNAHG